MQCIAFDSHKHYTWALVQDAAGKILVEKRIDHTRGALGEFLREFEPGSPVAVETIGNWYWITDEIEAAGMMPRLVNARRAKLMSGSINKTDKRGLPATEHPASVPVARRGQMVPLAVQEAVPRDSTVSPTCFPPMCLKSFSKRERTFPPPPWE